MTDNLRGIQLTKDETETLLHCLRVYEAWTANTEWTDRADALYLRLESLYPQKGKK